MYVPRDNQAYRFPVSIKGVIIQDSKVVLLKNERDEWELPGGKLELGELPRECVVREIKEELDLFVEAGPILDTWIYSITQDVHVLIITYICFSESISELICSAEHKSVGVFNIEEIVNLRIPDGYKLSINSALEYLVK